ncbi:hypothetical protein K491DRAFT_595108 [Lophiostoma macrostomum CBS 122681]|uniref:TPR-like protein n=1 Tax=Lophiostoma macrostomum CBS 122681 TaxID=1314788 RepID=A0A6A6TE83_9PLEO|nr:hypothetical protein K491DRAFT_595108 [Lophiostoma macrostomum CBS 122681]
MLVTGRGTIAKVTYAGEENAGEINKLLHAVVDNEDEFEPWEELVTKASSLEGGVTRNSSPSAIELVRNVFDCFLAKFPLFFGYWKKYADLEFSIGGTETAEMVYERGVSCISSCVDLWKDYCNFKIETCHNNDIIRELFERAAEFVGLDFFAHPFWEKYIDFEERMGESTNVAKIYARLIHLPTYQFNRYYEKFRAQINGTAPVESLTDAETLEQIQGQIKAEGQSYPANSPDLDRLLRTKIDAYYYEVYVRTQAEVGKRWDYEKAIKRGYFHVTPIEEEELVNWRKYLDLEEGVGDYKRIAFLYERCLVACALHEEFWLRYARWMFAQGKDEDARIIYMRASSIYVPIAEPTVRLHWARFEEKLDNIAYANLIHEQILEELPGHVETMISWAGVQRRHHGDQAALDKLEELIKANEDVAGRLTAEQARILWQCSGDIDKARQLFKDRSSNYPESRDFWLDYLRFEIAQPSVDQDEAHDRIKAVYDLMRAKARFSSEIMKELSHCYMAYLLDRGNKKAATEYMLLDKEVNGGLDGYV